MLRKVSEFRKVVELSERFSRSHLLRHEFEDLPLQDVLGIHSAVAVDHSRSMEDA